MVTVEKILSAHVSDAVVEELAQDRKLELDHDDSTQFNLRVRIFGRISIHAFGIGTLLPLPFSSLPSHWVVLNGRVFTILIFRMYLTAFMDKSCSWIPAKERVRTVFPANVKGTSLCDICFSLSPRTHDRCYVAILLTLQRGISNPFGTTTKKTRSEELGDRSTTVRATKLCTL